MRRRKLAGLSCLVFLSINLVHCGRVMSFDILFPFGLWAFGGRPGWLLDRSQLV